MSQIIICYYLCGIAFCLVTITFNFFEGKIKFSEEVGGLPLAFLCIFVVACVATIWPIWWIRNISKEVLSDKARKD